MGATSPILGFTRMQQRMEESEVGLNASMNIVEVLLKGSVKSRTTTAQPGSPANGDSYILPTGRTGTQWGTFTVGNVAYYYDGWKEITRREGMRLWVDDENWTILYDGSVWTSIANRITTATGITAFAGGGQASATQLTAEFNRVTVVATAADSVKLPAAVVGAVVTVVNKAANSMDVYPTSGEQIDGLGTNAPDACAAGAIITYRCGLAGQWESQTGA